MALKMTIREANAIITNMLERNNTLYSPLKTYTPIEEEAIKRLLRNGKRIESHMVKKPWSKSHEQICVVCGKSFMTKREEAIYCSQKCCNKAAWQRMKQDPERLKKHNDYNSKYMKQIRKEKANG